ncbi:hypothetical protein BH10PLA1_BH10PLA1_03190 [soil metagenome]
MAKHPTRPRDRKETAKARRRPASRTLLRADPTKSLAGCDDWPIVRAYLPPEDCWQSTGFGTAGIVREQPDGKLASSFFVMGLTRGGLMNVFGHIDSNWEEIEGDLRRQRHKMPPTTIGDPKLAARYIWGSYAWSLDDDLMWPDDLERQHLALIPPMSGSRNRWLGQFAGPTGLIPSDLYDLVKSIDPMLEAEADMPEPLVFTEITYAVSDQPKLLERFRSSAPHIAPMDQDLDTVYFECTREFNPRKVMPLEPMRSRQPIGTLRIQGGKLLAEARSLSTAAYLIGKVREYAAELFEFEKTHGSDLDAWLTSPEKGDPTTAY